jgi:hypothetical protein
VRTLRATRRSAGQVEFQLNGRLQTSSAHQGEVKLQFVLEVNGDTLRGVCSAIAADHHCLPHWVELRRL